MTILAPWLRHNSGSDRRTLDRKHWTLSIHDTSLDIMLHWQSLHQHNCLDVWCVLEYANIAIVCNYFKTFIDLFKIHWKWYKCVQIFDFILFSISQLVSKRLMWLSWLLSCCDATDVTLEGEVFRSSLMQPPNLTLIENPLII